MTDQSGPRRGKPTIQPLAPKYPLSVEYIAKMQRTIEDLRIENAAINRENRQLLRRRSRA